MSQIAQVQITFAAAEDRLLMRMTTNAREEFRFWLTRRFVAALRPHLGKSLSSRPRISTQPSADARRELLNFEREKAVGGADFKTPYQADPQALPLGEQPLLLTRFQIRVHDNDSLTLSLRPEEGNGIDLNLNADLLHSVLALMETAINAAEWNLPTTPAPAPDDGSPAVN